MDSVRNEPLLVLEKLKKLNLHKVILFGILALILCIDFLF